MLIEYMQYLKLQITELRSQLAEAIAHRNLYEPLIQQLEEDIPETVVMPPKPMGYFEWFRS